MRKINLSVRNILQFDTLKRWAKYFFGVTVDPKYISSLEELLKSVSGPLVVLNESGIIKIINAEAETLFGYEVKELLERKIQTLTPHYFSGAHQALLDKFQEGSRVKKVRLELLGKRKDGNEFPVEMSLSPLKMEGGLLVSVAMRDISMIEKIEGEYRFLANIANNIQEPVITLDNDSNIIRWNKAAEELLEWKADEVIGKNTITMFNLFFPNKTRYEIGSELETKGYWREELIFYTKSGKPINVKVTGTKLKVPGNSFSGQLLLVIDITTQKALEEKLKQFEYFFNNSNDFSSIANAKGYFEVVNPSFNRVLGYSNSELSTIPFIDFVHPDDIADTLQVYDQLKEGKKIIHFINRYRKKDGTYLYLDWNAVPFDITGKLYCIARDFTDRKIAEDALKKLNKSLEQEVINQVREIKKNERRFQALVENNDEIVSLIDESFKILYRSPSAHRITGWSDREMDSKSVIIHAHPNDLEYARGVLTQLMNSPGKSGEIIFRNQHKDGHYLWLEGTIINLLHDEDIKAIVFNIRDVTKRKELENLLNKANTLARIGGWNVDLAKGSVYWSDITREIHETEANFTPDLGAGISFYKEGETREIIKRAVNEAIESGIPWDLELEIVTAKKNQRWIRTIGETEFADGKCIKIYGSFQDITDRKSAEVELEQKNTELQKANSELDRFVYSASHDLRAPLKSLLGLIRITDQDAAPADLNLHEKLKMMKRTITKLDDFIEDILHFSRNARLDVAREEINFDELIREIDGNLKFINGSSGSGLKLKLEIKQDEKFISDKSRVSVVLNNLISNAIKYQDTTKDNLLLSITIHCDKRNAHIEIEDNGIGIEAQSQKRVFEMFYRATTLSTGSGLGLYIVKEVIEKLEGSITLESELKRGTKFTVVIPNLISTST